MDLAHIPRSFWHALSACMLMSTIGLLMIAYRSATVSIEIADAKINLSSAMATAKEIKSELQSENERLRPPTNNCRKPCRTSSPLSPKASQPANRQLISKR